MLRASYMRITDASILIYEDYKAPILIYEDRRCIYKRTSLNFCHCSLKTCTVWSVLIMAPVNNCNICGTMCEYVSNFNRHLLTHETEGAYSCQCCSYTCNRKDNLKRHLDKYHSEMSDIQVAQPLLNTDENAEEYPMGTFDKRLQLPHNFIYAGASQSVSFH